MPWFFLPGLSLALVIGFGLAYLPFVILAGLLTSLLIHLSPPPPLRALLLTLSAAVGYSLGALLATRVMGRQLQRIRDVAYFSLVVTIAATVTGTATAWLTTYPELRPTIVLMEVLREAFSMMSFTPLVLVHVVPRAVQLREGKAPSSITKEEPRERKPHLRSLLILLSEIGGSVILLWIALGPLSTNRRLYYLCFFPLIEVVLRYGLPGATVIIPAITLATTFSVRVYGVKMEPLLAFPLFVFSISLTGLLVGTLVTAQRRAEASLQRRTRELALLNRAVQALVSTLDLDQVLSIVLEEVRQVLGVVSTSVWLIDPQTGELVCRQVTGPRSHLVQGLRLAPGEGFAGWVVSHGESLIVANAQADPRHFQDVDQWIGLELQSVITVPLEVRGEVIGVLQAVDQDAGRFGPVDLALLEPLAATAAVAIETARLYEQAREDADTRALLLREVNHRVKNILSTIVGLLYAELRYADKEIRNACRPLLSGLVARVQGLSTVHSLLSTSEWRPLLLSDLTTHVIRSTLNALPRGKNVSFKVTASPIRVAPEQAHHLALVLNELVTNVVKHALRGRSTASITVEIERAKETVILRFRDDGPGYPEAVLRLDRHGVGFDLIRNLVQRNLRGEWVLYNEKGAVAEIRFKEGTNGTRGGIGGEATGENPRTDR
ncbi:MAG TPA: GAF domain-containing protein [Thermoflexia bacterium]|jgi:two-component sensor histidine kinase|nr:GAF domain-containing protein [Thermoflexia bacterium]